MEFDHDRYLDHDRQVHDGELPKTKKIRVERVVKPQPNTFTNADCMEHLTKCPDNYFDLAIVDPPYGIDIADWDASPPDDQYFNELVRTSKNQIIWGGNYFNLPHTEAWICWDKTFNDDIKGGKLTQAGVPREYMSDFELAWTSFDHKAKILRFTQIGNLIGFGAKIAVDYTHAKKIHPAQKHKLLYEWILREYAKAGDLILDTHVGSASSLIACKELGYNYVGYEIDKEYYEQAKRRLERAFRKYELEF